MTLYFATENQMKFDEAQMFLSGYEIFRLDMELSEPQASLEEIAKSKAVFASKVSGKNVFCEDTAVFFNAWNGLPGPYTKHFLKSLKAHGLYKTLMQFNDKTAYSQTVIAYCAPNQEPLIFSGRVDGKIIKPSYEDGNIGRFDRILVPDGYDVPLYKLTDKERSQVSHRGRAFAAFKEWLNNSHNF
jgi:inosine triphosphate pyrophosphatase